MKKQYIVVYIYSRKELVETLHFPSTSKAKAWLRERKCAFSDKLFVNLGNERVMLSIGKYTYKIEAEGSRAVLREEIKDA